MAALRQLAASSLLWRLAATVLLWRLAAERPVAALAPRSRVVEQPGSSRARALRRVELQAVEVQQPVVQAASAAPHPRCRAPLAPHLRPA